MKQKITTNREERQAFTLVELLISIAIFVIFMGVVSGSYISIVRAQRDANDVRKIYSEVRSFTDRFTEDVRLGRVMYECYGGSAVDTDLDRCPAGYSPSGLEVDNGKTNVLLIQKQDGLERVVYTYDYEEGLLKEKRFIRADDAWQESAGYETGELQVFSDLIEVEGVEFIVTPDSDPYAQANVYKNEKQFQPQVTIVMTLASKQNLNLPFKLNFQTTITSRVYSRK